MKFIKTLLLVCFLFQGCQNKNDNITLNQYSSTSPFLQNTEIPTVFIKDISEELFSLEIINKINTSVKINVEKNPGNENIIMDIFNNIYCNKKATVIIVGQNNTTGVSVGTFYNNVIIDSFTGELLKIIFSGEFKDKQTGEIISDDQKSTVTTLKSNSSIEQKCKK